MSRGSTDDGPTAFPEGFAGPITGLLALLFAVLAGVSAYPAVSGGSGLADLAVPIAFGGASIVFMYLKRRNEKRRSDEGE